MAVTIYPLSEDELLALQSAHTPNIATAMSSGIIQQHKANSIEDLGLLLSVSEVSEALGLGRNSTYALLRSGQLKSIRVGKLIKVPRTALEEYLQSY